MDHVEPKHSKKKVNRAGEMLIGKVSPCFTESEMFSIIDNWRIAHDYPLQILRNIVTEEACKLDTNSIIVDRLKRLPSIESKLRKQQSMNLARMQDIGGCRAILGEMNDARELCQAIIDSPAIIDTWEIVRVSDYFSEPKPDGYRGMHVICRIRCNSGELLQFNGLSVEIQIRTKLQHVWATAVEVVSLLTKQDLKRQIGTDDWKRFFVLASTLFGNFESLPVASEFPIRIEAVISELRALWRKLDVENRLSLFTQSIPEITNNLQNAKYFVLELDIENRSISSIRFIDRLAAWNMQTTLEKKHRDNTRFDVVMVTAEAVQVLKNAYPNYFLDTNDFLSLIEKSVNPGAEVSENAKVYNDYDEFNDNFEYD